MDPAAVVFDLDGVLIDSERAWDEVRRALVVERGGRFPPEATRAMQGMSTPEWAAYLVDQLGVAGPPDHVATEVVDRMGQRYAAELPLLPGAVDAVRRAAAHWPLGLASSSPPDLILLVLRAAGLAEEFRVVVSSEEVTRGKPAPDVYLAAAARLGVAARECVAVEDSTNGIRAAVNAGMTLIAVPNPHFPPPPDALALAAARIESVADLTPELIESL